MPTPRSGPGVRREPEARRSPRPLPDPRSTSTTSLSRRSSRCSSGLARLVRAHAAAPRAGRARALAPLSRSSSAQEVSFGRPHRARDPVHAQERRPRRVGHARSAPSSTAPRSSSDLRVGADDAATVLPISPARSSARSGSREGRARRARRSTPTACSCQRAGSSRTPENAGGGRDVFMRAPSGVDVRFQTAVQKKHEVIDVEMLRRVASGFLVDGLKVLTPKDMAAARARCSRRAAGPACGSTRRRRRWTWSCSRRCRSPHMIFALRGAPPTYHGRDLAVAWAALQSFVVNGVDRAVAGRSGPRRGRGRRAPRRVLPDRARRRRAGRNLPARVDLFHRAPSGRNGRHRPDPERQVGGHDRHLPHRGQSGDGRDPEGRAAWHTGSDGEMLRGEAPGEVLFRARSEETP